MLRIDADKLKRLKDRKFLSGYALAELAGVSRTTIMHAEQGRDLLPGTVGKICAALGCSFDDLVITETDQERS